MTKFARHSNPDDAPNGWWLGLVITLAVGITVSAYVGALAYNLEYAVLHGSAQEAISSVPRALLGMILSWPTAFVVGVVPITVSYSALRLIASYVGMTVPRRIGIGLALGTAMNILVLVFDTPYDPDTGQIGLTALRVPFFPYTEIQASALVLALVVRSRWFGVTDPSR